MGQANGFARAAGSASAGRRGRGRACCKQGCISSSGLSVFHRGQGRGKLEKKGKDDNPTTARCGKADVEARWGRSQPSIGAAEADQREMETRVGAGRKGRREKYVLGGGGKNTGWKRLNMKRVAGPASHPGARPGRVGSTAAWAMAAGTAGRQRGGEGRRASQQARAPTSAVPLLGCNCRPGCQGLSRRLEQESPFTEAGAPPSLEPPSGLHSAHPAPQLSSAWHGSCCSGSWEPRPAQQPRL